MAAHSSILAWKIPEEPGGLQDYSPQSCKESDVTERLHFHFHAKESGTDIYYNMDGSQKHYTKWENLDT